ncbi:hypothetical protein [Nocardia anaemiae]|uniref:hypothetical protein n=1 Tax=Nocardia anaemiae TaxID=263910 RepID=UPI000B23019C|nr:hypothetical protein [Nocardia anaemiae]
MTSAATPPATRTNPVVRFRQYRRYHRDLRPYALALPRETVSPRTLPLMRRLAARTRPHPAAVVTDLGDGARVRVFGDTGSRVPGPALQRRNRLDHRVLRARRGTDAPSRTPDR